MSSSLQYPESVTSTQLQVWNNAAFDGDENLHQGFSFPLNASWSSLHSSDSSKENMNPEALNSTTPFPSKKSLLSTAKKKMKGFDDREDENKIDDEIQQIENEIKRLSSRLDTLRLQKAAAAAAKTAEKRGRIVPAKFMEQKQSSALKVIEETPKAKVGVMRRGMSLGPAEISAGGGRFSRWPGKANANANANAGITPVPATTQSRRKSCFWKVEDVNEMKGGVSERKRVLSLSPKSKRIAAGRVDSSVQGVKHAAATITVGSRKSVKKEDMVVALVQPRKLFKEGEKSVPNKKPAKVGRVVASRYNSGASADARKRSWPENEKDDDGIEGGKRWDRKRASQRGSGQGSEVRVKKRWEIPAQVVVYKKSEEEEEEEEDEEEEEKKQPLVMVPSATADASDVLLPKIRILRDLRESPRDSGAAKRVADLTGKRSYFCPDEHMDGSVCQVLNFAEDAADG